MDKKEIAAIRVELNKLDSRIKQQDKEINTLQEQLKKGCDQKTLDLEKQVKEIRKLGDEVKTMLAGHHTIMQTHEQAMTELRKK